LKSNFGVPAHHPCTVRLTAFPEPVDARTLNLRLCQFTSRRSPPESPPTLIGRPCELHGDYMPKQNEEAENRSASGRLSRAARRVRESRNLTLVEVAAATGISRNTLFLIETKAANARLSTIDSLAQFMNVGPSQLLEKSPCLTPQLQDRHALLTIVAENIAAFRASTNISQEALGEAAGLAKGYVSLIEVSAPDLRINTVEAIAHVLGIDVTFLLADSREGLRAVR
jgi:transcriptional regulator with XRE-family HTH domain